MWLLESGELDVGVQPQSVVQIRGAALWLANDIEIWKAAHAVELAAAMNQVFPESAPQVLEHGAEAPGVASIRVRPVWVQGRVPGVFLEPTGALNTRKKFSRDDGEHLEGRRGSSG